MENRSIEDLAPVIAMLQSQPEIKYSPQMFGGTMVAQWGGIIGNIQNQTDLMEQLNILKQQIQNAVIGEASSIFVYKGQVNRKEDLPDNAQIGYVYDVKDTGANFVWNGTQWDKLSETFNIDGLPTAQDLEDLNTKIDNAIATLNGKIAQEKADRLAAEANFVNEQYVIDAVNPVVDGLNAEINARKAAIQGLATEEFVTNKIAEAQLEGEDVDLSGYATKSDLNDYVKTEDLPDNHLTAADIANKADKTEIPTKISELENDEGYLKEHQDITGKADKGEAYTKAEADAKFLTEEDHSLLATKEELETLEESLSSIELDNYYTKEESDDKYITEHQSLDSKQDVIVDLDDIRAGAALGATALQEHQDISGKANVSEVYTKLEIDAKLAAALTYKGSVETMADLPTEGLKVGDVYNIIQFGASNRAGDNVAWNGTEWDVLGGTQNLNAYAKVVDMNRELEGKVNKEDGKSLIEDTEIVRLALVDNYDDTQIRQDLSDLSIQVGNNKTSIEETVAHMQEHMDAVDANAEAITTNLNTINQNMTRIDTLETLTADQGTAINNLDTRMTNHGTSFNTWKESVNEILPNVATNTSDIDSLKTRVGENETAIDGLKDEVGANKTAIEANVATIQGLVDGLTARESFKGVFLHASTIQALEGHEGAYAHCAETDTKWAWSVANERWEDTGIAVEDTTIDKSDITPLMDGEAKIGDSNKYAAADHIHPTDTTRASQADFIQHSTSTLNPHNVTKEQIGLDQVDNTTDLNKPISLATQAALDNKVDKELDKELSSNDFTDELKAKLEAVETQATRNIIDVAIDANSENAVQNKAIKAALDLKVDVVENKGLSANDYTDEEKAKLADLENYELPEASDTALGGFKTGGSFSLDVDGTLLFTGEALGAKGDSAYKVATDNGFVGTEYEWVQSLKGDSAYQVAVNKGFTGNEEEWLEYIRGEEGKSTYQVWLDNDNEGTVDDFLTAMKGPQGKSAYDLWKEAGNVGTMDDYLAAIKGVDGQSAYELSGFTGTEQEWIESLQGVNGQSAYELSGFSGTEQEWLESLQGTNGKSAYELWLEAGNTGSKTDFLAAIKGQDGEDGVNPTAVATQLSNGAKITLTDKNGATEAEIHDGVGIANITKTGTTGNVDTYTITYTDNTTTTFEVANGSGNEITKVSDLENDSEFITNIVDNLINYYSKSETYTKAEVESMISTVSALNLQIVSNLNAVLNEGVNTSTIYLVETSEGSGVYTQYLWLAGANEWATLGTTSVDLSNYYNKSEIDNKLSLYASITFVTTMLANYTPSANLHSVATSGNYNELNNLPTIPSIEGLATETYVNTAVSGLADTAATTYRKVADKVPYSDVSGTPTLATVATSGSYNDLTDKPTIPEVTVDTALSGTSTNPVQNKAVHAALANKQDKLTIDTALSATSTNPVQNKAVQAALANKQDKMTVDTALSDSSTNPVQNKIIKAALDGKQNTMTIDAALSSTSTNPVQNKVINTALANKQDKLTIDTALSATSTNPVQNKVINTALALKQDKLTIDTGLSSTSTNVVTNKAIYDKFAQIEERISFLQTALQNMQIGGISSDKGVLISSENTLTSDFVVNYSKSFKVEVDFMVTVPNTRYILCGDYLSGRGDNSRLNLEVFSDNKYRIYMDNSHMVDIRIPDPLIEVDTRYNIVYNWNASTRTATSSVNGVEVYNQSWSANEVPTGAADRPMKIGSDHRSSFLTSLTIYKCKFSLL